MQSESQMSAITAKLQQDEEKAELMQQELLQERQSREAQEQAQHVRLQQLEA